MDLTQTLVSYTHSAFDRSPESFIAFRARHASDAYRYTVSDRVLTGYLGDAQLFAANLAEHTLDSLVRFISAQPGMSVVYAAPPDELRNSAMSLLDGSGAQVSSNGDCVYAYRSLLWALMHAYAIELARAEDAITDMLDQMSIATADNEFLDEWSGYFGFPRAAGELDAALRLRVLQEALRPRSNNMAIALAIEQQFGRLVISVADVTEWGGTFPLHGADKPLSIDHDGVYQHSAQTQIRYGLFDVELHSFAAHMSRSVLQASIGFNPLLSEEIYTEADGLRMLADLDGNGRISARDALQIYSYLKFGANSVTPSVATYIESVFLPTLAADPFKYRHYRDFGEVELRSYVASLRASGTQLRNVIFRDL